MDRPVLRGKDVARVVEALIDSSTLSPVFVAFRGVKLEIFQYEICGGLVDAKFERIALLDAGS